MKLPLLIYLIFLNMLCGYAQLKDTTLSKIACDCKSPVSLFVNPGLHYGPTAAPHSFCGGQVIRSSDKNSETSFTSEHNIAWYLLNINFDGEMSFVIYPTDTSDDYDFLLYPYKDSGFCHHLLSHIVTPLRGNMACNTPPKNHGATGLADGIGQAFHHQGPGDPFSMPLQVKKGEKYMLVLDNVTPHGGGHTIYFRNMMAVTINGTVTDSSGMAVIADVTMTDPKGKTIEQTSTNAQGNYTIKTSIEPNRNYNLTFTNDSCFVGTETINTNKLKGSHTFSDIKTILPKLKKGAKYPLGNINFYGSSPELLPQSIPSVEALFHLMQKNKTLSIRIEGHVNAANMSEADIQRQKIEFQNLSENRSRTVRDYLVKKGIAFNRIGIIGYAARYMLYPDAKNEAEQSANRRVEIKVMSLNGE